MAWDAGLIPPRFTPSLSSGEAGITGPGFPCSQGLPVAECPPGIISGPAVKHSRGFPPKSTVSILSPQNITVSSPSHPLPLPALLPIAQIQLSAHQRGLPTPSSAAEEVPAARGIFNGKSSVRPSGAAQSHDPPPLLREREPSEAKRGERRMTRNKKCR